MVGYLLPSARYFCVYTVIFWIVSEDNVWHFLHCDIEFDSSDLIYKKQDCLYSQEYFILESTQIFFFWPSVYNCLLKSVQPRSSCVSCLRLSNLFSALSSSAFAFYLCAKGTFSVSVVLLAFLFQCPF